jgi:hypothetical protein
VNKERYDFECVDVNGRINIKIDFREIVCEDAKSIQLNENCLMKELCEHSDKHSDSTKQDIS